MTITKALEKPGMNLYLSALLRIYPQSEKMREYCISTADEIVCLENGFFFVIKKEKIETEFCFGYSDTWHEEDMDRANRCVENAYSNEEFFVRENLKCYRQALDQLSDDSYVPVLRDCYYSRETGNLKSLEFLRYWAWEMRLRNQTAGEIASENTAGNSHYYVMTKSDIARTVAAYERAMQRQEKKVRAYLKRYGLSKIHAWSYWRDA